LMRIARPHVPAAAAGCSCSLSAWLLLLPAGRLGVRPVSRFATIQVEGVQRTEAGTVFSYLPIKVGRAHRRTEGRGRGQGAVRHRFSSATCASKPRAMSSWSSSRSARPFSSLTFRRQQGIRQPTRSRRALKDVGIAEALIFDRAGLEAGGTGIEAPVHHEGQIRGEPWQTTVTPQERNRVAINFTIVEGETASISRINIVGNKGVHGKRSCARRSCSRTPNWLSWYTKDDQYSKAEADGRPGIAEEPLPEPGLPRVQHRIDAGVDLGPTRKRSSSRSTSSKARRYYTVSSVNVLGRPGGSGGGSAPPDTAQNPATASRARSCRPRSRTSANGLGVDGYAFANVNAVPDIDRAKSTGRLLRSTSTPGRPRLRPPGSISPAIHGPRRRRSSGVSCGNWKTGGTTGRGSSGSKVARCRPPGILRGRQASTSKHRRCRERRTRSTST